MTGGGAAQGCLWQQQPDAARTMAASSGARRGVIRVLLLCPGREPVSVAGTQAVERAAGVPRVGEVFVSICDREC